MLLFRNGLAESRERARRMVMEGKVRTGSDRLVAKPSDLLPEDTVFIVEPDRDFVGRGAYKLLPAIERHPPPRIPFVAADIGASTGGFCDVLLRSGAARIYAVDSGRGQLHQKIRSRPEIVCMEETNARHLDEAMIREKIDVLTMDVSFISVKKILPSVALLLAEEAMVYVLVKPQFEAERKEVGKGGVVKDPEVIERCVRDVANFAVANFGWIFLESIPSPITGPKGNREQMLVFRKALLHPAF